MVTVTTIKKSYKQTELGMIPEDWDIKKLDEIFSITAGGDLIKDSYSQIYDSNHPYPIYSNSLEHKGLYGYSKIARHKENSVTITARGTVGKANARNHKFDAIGRLLIMEPIKDLSCLFISEYINNRVKFSIESTGVPQLTAPQASKYFVVYPDPKEQSAIATALFDTDELIEQLEELIAKKKAIKQGMMQQLLTCKKRLPGFNERWEEKKLGDISEIESGINKPLSFIGKGGSKYITVLELYEGSQIQTEKAGRIEVSNEEIRKYLLQRGDIVFGKSSVKREGIGYPNIFVNYKEPAVFSGFTFRARINKNIGDPFFIIQILRMPCTRRWLINNSQASALTNINQTIANNIPVYIPLDKKEQTAIAQVLSDIDVEIEGMEQKRDKYIMIKQGMMQQLLTGKIRLYATN